MSKQPIMKRSDQPFFTPEQKKFIKADLKEKGLGEFQQEQFLITCERTLLDPFSRQIYARPQAVLKKFPGGSEEWIKELIIITAIDGLRAVAERSGEYKGQTPVEWYGTDPDTGKLGWLPFWSGVSPQFPEAARVGVHRAGFVEPLIGVARYLSFVQMTKGYRAEGNKPAKAPQPTQFWLKMPDVMIAKCAEAIALRKAFPLLLSGIFLEEEIKEESELAETERQPEPENPAEKTVIIPAPAPVITHSTPDSEEAPEKPAEPKRTRKPKPAAETPAEAPAAPEAAPVEKPAQAPKPAAGGAAWMDHVIATITVADYAGRKVGELSPEEIKKLKTSWVDKYAPKIALNPDKVKEAAMITAAHEHHFPASK